MCALGRALMSKPETILLDEPSMGLAPQLVEQIFEIVKSIGYPNIKLEKRIDFKDLFEKNQK